jgi:hypothetical protein
METFTSVYIAAKSLGRISGRIVRTEAAPQRVTHGFLTRWVFCFKTSLWMISLPEFTPVITNTLEKLQHFHLGVRMVVSYSAVFTKTRHIKMARTCEIIGPP